MKRALYLTYDGLTDPLGRSQIVPYVLGLARQGYRLCVVSFEKAAAYAQGEAEVRRLLEREGVEWEPLRYTKRPPIASTVWDLRRMFRAGVKLHRRAPFALVHCRSYLSAIVGLALKRRFGIRLLFDMRGFLPDEKVEDGSWNVENPMYRAVHRYLKAKEAELLAGSDGIVVLTAAGREVLHQHAAFSAARTPVGVIPCSADFDAFRVVGEAERAAARSRLGIPDEAMVLCYLGSLGGCYMLEEMLDFFVVARESYPDARFLFVTPSPTEMVTSAAQRRGLAAPDVVCTRASRAEVPGVLGAADAGIFFIRPTPAKRGSSPTKMGEFLAMGIPVVTNGGVGDVSEILAEIAGGVVVEGFDDTHYRDAVGRLPQLLDSDRTVLRERARSRNDLSVAIDGYRALYDAVLSRREPDDAPRPRGWRPSFRTVHGPEEP